MMKHYVYRPSHVCIQMTIPGLFTWLIGIFCFIRFLSEGRNPVYLMILCLCIYNVWNVFISVSNPSEIMIRNGIIEFYAYGKSHKYKIDQIQSYHMRPLAGNTRMYMTFNNGGILKGRYWIRISEFSNKKELENYFYDLDSKINPDSLVTEARIQGRKRLKTVLQEETKC